MAHLNRLQDARVLVFGGTSGIGFGVASMALSQGSVVYISGSTQAKVDDKIKELQSLYPSVPKEKVLGYACDLSDTANLEANLKAMFDKVTEKGEKKVDHIAFTAGDALKLPKIQEVTAEDALGGFTVRLLGAAFIAKLLSTGRYMHSTTSSSFTLTSGTNTLKPLPGWSLGASWGAAIEGLGRGLAVDLKPIRVNVMAPGTIETPILQKFISKAGPEYAKKMRETGSLVENWGQPEDVAEAYGWFMKDRFVTGSLAESNGGRMLR